MPVKTDQQTTPVPGTQQSVTTHEAVRRKITGYLISQCIFVGVRLGVFDRLAQGPATAAALATELNADADALGRFLNALRSEELLAWDGEQFSLTAQGELLVSTRSGSLAHLSNLMDRSYFAAWAAAEYSVRTGEAAYAAVHGKPMFEWFSDHPDAAAEFYRSQAALAPLSSAPLTGWDWSGANTVVDVGGGNGDTVRWLLQRYPHLSATVYDRPHTARQSELAAAADIAERCQFVGGDFFEKVPSGADVYILSQILHDWDDEAAGKILSNCAEAMPANGRLLVVEQILTETDELDLPHLLDLQMLVLLGGRERTVTDWKQLLSRAGFSFRSIRQFGGTALIEATPGA